MVIVLFDSINSYDDLGLFLKDVKITEPEPKRTIVEVPGRNGALDLTYSLSSEMRYKNRKITLEFKKKDYTNDWMATFSAIAKALHGKIMKVRLDSDLNWYWDSFVTVSPSNAYNVGTIVITCDAYPYKRRPVTWTGTATSGGTEVALPVTMEPVIPEVTNSNNITITANGSTYSFDAGTHKNQQMKLTAGTNNLVVKGSGSVTIRYLDGCL